MHFEILAIIFKPFDYKRFEIKYNTIKETTTESTDIRDTNYTMKIIEINEEINENKYFINNKWIGIFYNKKISELQLLNKKVEEEDE